MNGRLSSGIAEEITIGNSPLGQKCRSLFKSRNDTEKAK
jgi:hypothetical protein